MNKKIFNMDGQSTLEFVIIFVIVVAALLSMQVYIKRGISGKLRQISDDIGPQYEPTKTSGFISSRISRNEIINVYLQQADENITAVTADGQRVIIPTNVQVREESFNEEITTTGSETVGGY